MGLLLICVLALVIAVILGYFIARNVVGLRRIDRCIDQAAAEYERQMQADRKELIG